MSFYIKWRSLGVYLCSPKNVKILHFVSIFVNYKRCIKQAIVSHDGTAGQENIAFSKGLIELSLINSSKNGLKVWKLNIYQELVWTMLHYWLPCLNR